MSDPTPSPILLAPLESLTRRLHLASESAAASEALARASARFIAEVGYSPLAVTDDVVTLDGNSTQVLLLPGAPVSSVASVELDGDLLSDWSLSTRLGMVHRRAGWPLGFGNVVVTYSHGWAADAIPGDIADAVLEQAEALHRTPAGIAQSSLGPQSVSFNSIVGGGSGKTQRWTDAVARYQRGRTMPA